MNLLPKSAVAVSHVGKRRKDNQDMALIAGEYIRDKSIDHKECEFTYPLIAAVADGMGGHAAGEVASETILRGLEEGVRAREPVIWDHEQTACKALMDIIKSLHAEIGRMGKENPEMKKMGTTLTGIVVGEAGHIYMYHVGDSRLYHYHDGSLKLLTKDHTLNRQRKMKFGDHILVNVMGGGIKRIYVDFLQIDARVQAGDLLMLSSDGLHGPVSGFDISSVLNMDMSLEDKADMLLKYAMHHGGHDNITLVLVQF